MQNIKNKLTVYVNFSHSHLHATLLTKTVVKDIGTKYLTGTIGCSATGWIT